MIINEAINFVDWNDENQQW